MKIWRWVLALLLAWAAMGVVPAIARADDGVVVSVADGGIAPPEDLERWWGAAGAVLCGGEGLLLRTNPVVGLNPYVMAAGIAGCGLMLLDMAT